MKITDYLKEKKKVTIAFLGDSVTHGYFESGDDMHASIDYEAVYHNVIKNKLLSMYPDAKINIINAGIGGDTARKGFNRMDKDVLSQNPLVTVVCYGLNDINWELTKYIDGLKDIFDKLKCAGIETIFMTPNMLNTYVDGNVDEKFLIYAERTAGYQNSGRMDEYISAAVKLAKDMGVTVCDCYSIWKKMYADGEDTTAMLANKINHPTREMHNLFADELFKILL